MKDAGEPDAGSESGASREEDWAESEHQRRVEALRALAGNNQPPLGAVQASASPSPRRTAQSPEQGRRPRRKVLTLTLVALAALLIVAGITTAVIRNRTSSNTGPHTPGRAAFTTIVPAETQLHVPVAVAWSPDGRRIAVLGYTNATGGGIPFDGLVNIYDTTTGQLVGQIHPDTLIGQKSTIAIPSPAASNSPNAQPSPSILYQALLWSGDGTRLALPFVVQQTPFSASPPFFPSQAGLPAPSSTPTLAGVLLTDATGSNTQVLTAPYVESIARIEWNLTSGKIIAPALTLAPALAYQWGANGSLQPQTPATGASAQTGPVGNSDGGASFTIWQPGEAALAYVRDANGNSSVPNLYLWYSHFAAWSPDGRYLITPAYTGGRIAVPGAALPDANALAETGNTRTPLLPVRDSALQHLYVNMVPDASGGPAPAKAVAWSPGGRVIAALGEAFYSPDAVTYDTSQTSVTLFDTQTGQQLTTLKAATALQFPLYPLGAQYIWLSWSPDGSHLLLLDAAIGTLTVWSVGTATH